MKKYLDGVLVVEGKEDASYLSNYIDSEIVIVNGYELADATINYLKNKKVIAFLDPDEAGQIIRKRLNEKLNNVIHIEVDIKKCTRATKNGVAECEIDEILAKLAPHFIEKPNEVSTIDIADLNNIGAINNEEIRQYVCHILKLGKCNNKQFLKRINSNHVQLEEIEKIVKEFKDGN